MKVSLACVVLVGLRLSSSGELPASSYKDAVLADKPFAYYRLNEAVDTQPVADEIGKNPGAYVNGPKVGAPGAIATDRKSTAVAFAGEGKPYIKLTNLGQLGSSLSAGFSAEYWLKTTDSIDHQTIFGSNLPEHGRTAFISDIGAGSRARQLRLFCRDNHSNSFEARFSAGGKNVDLYDDAWHHIVYVFDPNAGALADQVCLYVDASRQQLEVRLKNALPMPSDFKEPVTLAASNFGGPVQLNLQGSLDEVAFYLHPLSEAQIATHYRAAGRDHAAPVKKPVPAPAGFHEFPAPPTVEDADPAIRHKETIQFPTKLVFDQFEGALTVGVDQKESKPVDISVGSKMIVGTRDKIFVYPKGQARPEKALSEGLTGGAGLGYSRSSINFMLQAGGGSVPGRIYVIEMLVEVFETDLPPQHMWMPEGHQFKVLYSETLKAEKIVRP